MKNKIKAIQDFLYSNTLHTYTIGSNSMCPLFVKGQRITAKPIKGQLQCGKCYIYIDNNELFIHRLYTIRKKHAYFIGDNSQKKEKISMDRILAEPETNQNLFILFLVKGINSIFCSLTTYFPSMATIRIKIIRFLIIFERILHERKV